MFTVVCHAPMRQGVDIHTTLEKLVSHVTVETPIIKPPLSSKYGEKSCFALPKPFQKLVQIHTGVFIQKHIRKL